MGAVVGSRETETKTLPDTSCAPIAQMDDRILGIPGDGNGDCRLSVRFHLGGCGGIWRAEPDVDVLQPVSWHAG